MDSYRTINKAVKPDKDDVDCFKEVLDLDKDGKVSYYDVEKLVERYLANFN